MSDLQASGRGGGLDVQPALFVESAAALTGVGEELGVRPMTDPEREILRRGTDPLCLTVGEATAQGLHVLDKLAKAIGVTPATQRELIAVIQEAQKFKLTAMKMLRGVLDGRLVIAATARKAHLQLVEKTQGRLDGAQAPEERERLGQRLARLQARAEQQQADQQGSRDETLRQINELDARIAEVQAEAEMVDVMATIQAGREAELPKAVLQKAARTFEQLNGSERRGRGR